MPATALHRTRPRLVPHRAVSADPAFARGFLAACLLMLPFWVAGLVLLAARILP